MLQEQSHSVGSLDAIIFEQSTRVANREPIIITGQGI